MTAWESVELIVLSSDHHSHYPRRGCKHNRLVAMVTTIIRGEHEPGVDGVHNGGAIVFVEGGVVQALHVDPVEVVLAPERRLTATLHKQNLSPCGSVRLINTMNA